MGSGYVERKDEGITLYFVMSSGILNMVKLNNFLLFK